MLRRAISSAATAPSLLRPAALTSGSRAFHAAQWRRDESTSATPAAPAAAVNTENTVADASSPKATALKWLEAVPGQDKAYNVLVGTSLAAILLGKEIVPYTADMVYAIPFSAAIYIAYGQLGPMIGDLVKSVFTEEAKIWNDSKAKAEAALEQEIHQITGSGVTDLVQVTENLFDYAREVAKLEAEAFEHEQRLAYHTKAKQVLDEWVRYEAGVREKEQRRIAEEVMAGVMESIKDPKFQDKYLAQCLDDVAAAVAK